MPMRKRPCDLEVVASKCDSLSAQASPDDVNEMVGEMREIAEGLVLDMLPDSVGTAKEMGGVDLALASNLDLGHVHGPSLPRHACIISQ